MELTNVVKDLIDFYYILKLKLSSIRKTREAILNTIFLLQLYIEMNNMVLK